MKNLLRKVCGMDYPIYLNADDCIINNDGFYLTVKVPIANFKDRKLVGFNESTTFIDSEKNEQVFGKDVEKVEILQEGGFKVFRKHNKV